ncbi:unnamed protein product [Prorocentrum cordatum]|uniref:PDZ domain-containing protein n=1 Tax=Prorocentrum cordatum TaxID=2364126 RepID=A0ABN9T5U2_9DINO|nr:unnamed protein product [Polarella glacialis]
MAAATGGVAWQQRAARGECPEGHELLPWTAKEGSCCGCGKLFPSGEQVMDCRRCDWFLCEMCCPRYGRTPSLWGQLSQLPFYAAERLCETFDATDAALDSIAEHHDRKIDEALDAVEQAVASAGRRAAKVPAMAWVSDLLLDDFLPEADAEEARREQLEGTEEQRQEAQELVAEFCESWREVCAEPTDTDLGAFWSRCCVLYSTVLEPGPLAEALATQLRREAVSGQDGSWQPVLRALCALRDFRRRGAVGEAIAAEVAKRAGGRIRSLAKVEECAEEADQVGLALLGEEGAFDGAWTNKTRPGFTVEVISGDSLRMHSGATYDLVPCGFNCVSASQRRGREQLGELKCGEIVWSTGSTWIRHTGPLPGRKASAASSSGVGVATGVARSRTPAVAPRAPADTMPRALEGTEWTVVVDKPDPGAKLGLDITFRERLGIALRIKSVNQGLISEWNLINPEREIKANDWIVEVNGIRGSADQMLEEIGTSLRFRLQVLRESVPGSAPPAASAAAGAAARPPARAPAQASQEAAATAQPAAAAQLQADPLVPAPAPAAVEAPLISLEPAPASPAAAPPDLLAAPAPATAPMVRLAPPPQATVLPRAAVHLVDTGPLL